MYLIFGDLLNFGVPSLTLVPARDVEFRSSKSNQFQLALKFKLSNNKILKFSQSLSVVNSLFKLTWSVKYELVGIFEEPPVEFRSSQPNQCQRPLKFEISEQDFKFPFPTFSKSTCAVKYEIFRIRRRIEFRCSRLILVPARAFEFRSSQTNQLRIASFRATK